MRKRCTQLRLFEIETLYLYSKELMLYTLFSENDCTHGHLFGNILQPGVKYNKYQYDFEEKKIIKVRRTRPDFIRLSKVYRNSPSRLVYRRGYKDKGSLPPYDKKARTEANIESRYYEIELEKQRLQLLAINKRMILLFEMKSKGIGS